jgi:cation:H+ antiporter
MGVGLAVTAFMVGAVISLGTSWVLISRLERVGERFGLSEAALGLLAALAADTPEITSAVTAIANHQRALGAGVVIGSNIFNLAALLGLGAVVAGRLGLHRRVVVLGGAVAMWVAVVCFMTVMGVVGPAFGLLLALAVLLPYVVALSAHRVTFRRIPLPRRWMTWLRTAIDEEELDLGDAIRPPRGRPRDALVASSALVVVVVASVIMERGASALGGHYDLTEIVVGGLILAAVTSMPNAVAAVYLAAKGRGAAALSTALNSNNINVVAGLLIPATIIGIARSSGPGLLIVIWYVGLTGVALVLAYTDRGLRRGAGWVIILGYAAFVSVVLAVA